VILVEFVHNDHIYKSFGMLCSENPYILGSAILTQCRVWQTYEQTDKHRNAERWSGKKWSVIQWFDTFVVL